MKRGMSGVALSLTVALAGMILLAGALTGRPVSANLAPQISDVRVSNARDIYFVISWVTDEPSSGEVRYGASPALGEVAYDVRGASYVGRTHYVAVTGLAPSTTYYYDVVSGGTVSDNGGAHHTTATGPTASVRLVPNTAYATSGRIEA